MSLAWRSGRLQSASRLRSVSVNQKQYEQPERREATMKFMRSFLVTSLAAVLCMTASMLMAQDNGGGNGGGRTGGGGGGGGGGFGNFDPAQIQQRRMDNIHEQM